MTPANRSIRYKEGPPHTFGWLRRSDLDGQSPHGGKVWEKPDGSLVALPHEIRRVRVAILLDIGEVMWRD